MKKLRVGILGIRRGTSFVTVLKEIPTAELVAICDFDENRVRVFVDEVKDVVAYSEYDKFLEHDMDAVIVAGYCPDHAPNAIKALKKGKHVFSEVMACATLADGVSLCRAVEESGKTYMFAENLCFLAYTQEMKRLYEAGTIGEYLYGECEYVHDGLPIWHLITDGPDHWRNWIPPTYYCAHSLGPILTITGTRPVKVAGFIVPNRLSRTVGRRGDDGGVLICTMDNGALTKVLPWCNYPREPGSHWYCLYGTKGVMENNRWPNEEVLHVFTEQDPDAKYQKSYQPRFRKYASEAEKAGHLGCDFFTVQEFIDAILQAKPSPIDVYQAMDMTLPGILGYRSALGGSVPLEVPDFRDEKVRVKYENDHWSPFPQHQGIPGQPPPSVLGNVTIPESVVRLIAEKRRAERTEYEHVRY